MKAYHCGAFILPGFRDHNLCLRAEAVRLKTEDLTLTMEIRAQLHRGYRGGGVQTPGRRCGLN